MNGGQPRAEKRVIKFAGCQVNVVEKLENLCEFIINVGAQEILAAHRSPPRRIGHFLVRLNGASVVDWHAARML